MYSSVVYLIGGFVAIVARPREPQCSQFDFAEKTLEKVVRFEHNNELNINKLKEMERKMQHELEKIDDEVENKFDKREITLDNKLREVEKSLLQIKEFQDGVSKSLTEFKTETDEMLQNQKNELEKIKDQIKTPTILFKAKDATVSSLSKGDVIIFPNDVMNVGGGYNNKTGVFTAPVNGVYMFTTQFCIHKEKALYINIVAEDKVISASYFIQDHYSGVCYTSDGVTVLEQGDDVVVTVRSKNSGTIIYSDNSNNYWWTSFSGVLLHQ